MLACAAIYRFLKLLATAGATVLDGAKESSQWTDPRDKFCRVGFVFGEVIAILDNQIRRRQYLFRFRNRSLPFWTVDATTGNQAFRHYRCNVFPGLSYNNY